MDLLSHIPEMRNFAHLSIYVILRVANFVILGSLKIFSIQFNAKYVTFYWANKDVTDQERNLLIYLAPRSSSLN